MFLCENSDDLALLDFFGCFVIFRAKFLLSNDYFLNWCSDIRRECPFRTYCTACNGHRHFLTCRKKLETAEKREIG